MRHSRYLSDAEFRAWWAERRRLYRQARMGRLVGVAVSLLLVFASMLVVVLCQHIGSRVSADLLTVAACTLFLIGLYVLVTSLEDRT